jgi:hypothetical protein
MICCRFHLDVLGLERIVELAQFGLSVRNCILCLGKFAGE